jgi:hypothetical protein
MDLFCAKKLKTAESSRFFGIKLALRPLNTGVKSYENNSSSIDPKRNPQQLPDAGFC